MYQDGLDSTKWTEVELNEDIDVSGIFLLFEEYNQLLTDTQ